MVTREGAGWKRSIKHSFKSHSLIETGDFPPLGDCLVTEADVYTQEDTNRVVTRFHVRLYILLQVSD